MGKRKDESAFPFFASSSVRTLFILICLEVGACAEERPRVRILWEVVNSCCLWGLLLRSGGPRLKFSTRHYWILFLV